MDIITEFVTSLLQSGVVIAAFCLCIGVVIKKATSNDAPIRKYIPAICLVVGAAIGALASGYLWPDYPVLVSAIHGAIVGVAATGLYETFKSKKDTAK